MLSSINLFELFMVLVISFCTSYVVSCFFDYAKSKHKKIKQRKMILDLVNLTFNHVEDKKVFCKDCEWFKEDPGSNGLLRLPLELLRHKCTSIKNITIIKTPIEEIKSYNKKPQDLNKDNNCKWFIEKKVPEIKEGKMKKGGLNSPNPPKKPKPKPTPRGNKNK